MSGVKDGEFDRVTIARDLGVGRRSDFGEQGQVLTSAGQNNELFWGTNSATLPESLSATSPITFTPSGSYNGSVATSIGLSLSALTFGTGITATPNEAYDGSTAITITADSDTTLNLIAGSGINILANGDNRTITADIDNNTLEFSASPKEIQVKKLPHTLTITNSSGTIVFDGDQDESITISDSDTTYLGGNGIEIDLSTTPNVINADLKVGSGLVFDGGEIDLENIPNTALANSTISGKELGTNLANLVQGDNIIFSTGTTYNGGTEITISSTAPDGGITTLIGGDGIIVEDDSTTQKTIKADLKSGSGLVFDGGGKIDLENIPNTALANSTISGKELGTNLSGLSFGTGITATPDIVYDGQTAVTITADTDSTLKLIAGSGINITTNGLDRTITADIDNDTLGFTSAPKEIAVKKLPNVLTFGTGITATPDKPFDGSTAITITSTDADTTLNLIAGLGISIVSNGLDRTIAFTKLANALTVTTPLLDFTSGSSFDGSNATEIRPNTQVRRKEINPSSATNYDIYRRVNTNGFPSATDIMYPIDTKFNLQSVPSIRHANGGPYGYKVTVSFTMLVDSATVSATDGVYVRIDSNNSNAKGYTAPQFISGGQDSGGSNQGHHRHHATFQITHATSVSNIDLFPVVAVYNTSGTNDSRTNTPRITYGAKFGNLVMDVTPLQVLSSEASANPYSIPVADDY